MDVEIQFPVGELGAVGGLRQVETAVHGEFHRDAEPLRDIQKLPQGGFFHVQGIEHLAGGQFLDLTAVAGDH